MTIILSPVDNQTVFDIKEIAKTMKHRRNWTTAKLELSFRYKLNADELLIDGVCLIDKTA